MMPVLNIYLLENYLRFDEKYLIHLSPSYPHHYFFTLKLAKFYQGIYPQLSINNQIGINYY